MSEPTRPVSAKYQQHRPDDVHPLDYYAPNMVRPSPPDPRDFRAEDHSPHRAAAVPLPRRYMMDDPWGLTDQDGRPSCAAFAAVGQARTAFHQAKVDFDPSEEAEYALALEAEGTLGQAVGTYPRDHQKIMNQIGIADEADAPFLSHDYNWTPDANLRAKMSRRKTDKYYVAGSHEAIKREIYGTGTGDGRDVSACFTLYHNFIPDQNANIPLPAGTEWGGHNGRFRGWDDDRVMPGASRPGAYYFKNQWWTWGDALGGAWISYEHCDLPEDRGGLWWGDTWVTLIAALPEPEPAPNPTPDPTPAPTDEYTRGRTEAIAEMDQVSIEVQATIGAERAAIKTKIGRERKDNELKGATRMADALGDKLHMGRG